jgi:two-component system sensor histidine kinase YesM
VCSSDLCALEEEISHARVYAELLQLRHGRKFQMRVDLDAQFDRNVSIRFMLQPLIENVVTHGMKPLKLTNGRVVTASLTGRAENGALLLSLTDDGAGLSPEQLDALNHALDAGLDQLDAQTRALMATPTEHLRERLLQASLPAYEGGPDTGHGFGMRNVNNRIKLIFGKEYGITLQPGPQGGITVRIRLPRIVR